LEFLKGVDFSIYTGQSLDKAGNYTVLEPETSSLF